MLTILLWNYYYNFASIIQIKQLNFIVIQLNFIWRVRHIFSYLSLEYPAQSFAHINMWVKQGTYMEGCLGLHRMSRSLPPPSIILKVYMEALTGLSHTSCPDGLNNTLLSQGQVLENGSHCGSGWQNVHSKDRGGREGGSNSPGPTQGSTGGHVLWMASSNTLQVHSLRAECIHS